MKQINGNMDMQPLLIRLRYYREMNEARIENFGLLGELRSTSMTLFSVTRILQWR